MARIYVASSWRNQYYPEVVKRLREAGHDVYDFRNPPHGGNGFRWTDIDENALSWSFRQYAEGLHHPKAERQFKADEEALEWADTCVLVLPCGRSAHTEAGWFAGARKKVIAYIPEMVEPELMYKLFDGVVGSPDELIEALRSRLKKVRITALRRATHPDLMEKYENPIEHACDVNIGQSWISTDGQKPEGLCSAAWESMRSFVEALARGEGNFYDGWMQDPHSAMISCNDGFRPVSFYLEVIE
jgi:uncharacterized repeat protein (TIGR04076 family)